MTIIRKTRLLLANYLHRRKVHNQWKSRINDVMNSPDNAKIPRVKNAGSTKNGMQIMHNGLLVHCDGYYGQGMTELLRKNKGCHEPQEEFVFARILTTLLPNASMLELGAYWGFYSLWFAHHCPNGTAVLVEPDAKNLNLSKLNFAANNLRGHFIVGGIDRSAANSVTVDALLVEQGLTSLDILHSDIQGAEFEMLQGACVSIKSGMIKNVFISTHSEELHTKCREFLAHRSMNIVADVTPVQSFSVDGLLVARHHTAPEIMESLQPSIKH